MKLNAFQFQFVKLSYNDTHCICVFIWYEFQLICEWTNFFQFLFIEKSNVSYILKHIFNANQTLFPAWKDIKGEKHFDSVQEKLCSFFNHNHFSIQSTRSIWKLLLFLYPINIYCLWSYQLLFILETRVHFCFKTNLFLIPSLIPGNLNLSTTIFLFNYPSLSLFSAIWFIVTCNKWLNILCNNRNHEVIRTISELYLLYYVSTFRNWIWLWKFMYSLQTRFEVFLFPAYAIN